MNLADKTMEQAPWLARAREQSRRRAEQAAEVGAPPPLEWEALEGTGRPPRSWSSPGLRFTWVTALGLALLVSSATGTWAYVSHLKRQAAKEEQVEAAAAREAAALLEAKPKRRPRAAAPAPAAKPAPTPEPAVAVAPAARPKLARKARKKAAPKAAAKKLPPKPPGEVMFDDPSMPGGGHVIIVTPPFRMEPLFKVERFRQKGPGGSSR